MADKRQPQQQKPGSDGIPRKVITLYAKLIGDENVQLTKDEKELFAALLAKRFPQLSVITELADMPVKVPLKVRTKQWGNRLFYAACGIGGVFALYIIFFTH